MADNDTPLIKLIGNETNNVTEERRPALDIDTLFNENMYDDEMRHKPMEGGKIAIVFIIFLIGAALYITIDCERSKKGKVYYESEDDSLTIHIEDGKGVHSINENSLLTTYDKDEKVIIMELMHAHKVFGIPLKTLKRMEYKK